MTTPEKPDPEAGPRARDRSTGHDPGRQRRSPRIERDIFGDEYWGERRVFRLTLDVSRLPPGARHLLDTLLSLQGEAPDLAPLFTEAIQAVDPNFWAGKIAELTPFEWNFAQALEEPEFLAQVKALLDAGPLRWGLQANDSKV